MPLHAVSYSPQLEKEDMSVLFYRSKFAEAYTDVGSCLVCVSACQNILSISHHTLFSLLL